MIRTKRVIFMILPLLFVPLVYGISYTPNVCAERPASGWQGSTDCRTWGGGGPSGVRFTTCCWTENGVKYCQTCVPILEGSNEGEQECTPKEKQSLEQPPTTPTFDPTAPLQGGVLEQPEQPLFGGQNDAGVPPTGGIEQPPTTNTPQTPPRLPGGGANVPTEEGSAEQPPTPQQNQGGGLPNIKNQENVPPGGGVAEQPEDDGQQEDSSEGAETAGPLT